MAIPTFRHFINGQYVESTGSEVFDLVSPVDAQVYGRSPNATQADVDAAYDAALAAFAEWRKSTPSMRQKALLGLADAVEQHADRLIDAQSRATGQIKALIRQEEVLVSADQLRFFAGAARLLEGRASSEYMEGLTSTIRREPLGVVGQVTPWNYPLMMAVWKIAPALAAGNTVVLKPSDTTPESTLVLAELAQAFLPAGAFNVVLGKADAGERIVSHPRAELVSITGSVRAGKAVAAAAAAHLTHVNTFDFGTAQQNLHILGPYSSAGHRRPGGAHRPGDALRDYGAGVRVRLHGGPRHPPQRHRGRPQGRAHRGHGRAAQGRRRHPRDRRPGGRGPRRLRAPLRHARVVPLVRDPARPRRPGATPL